MSIFPLIIEKEVEEAIKAMKSHKSPGIDDITVEVLKASGVNMIGI